MRRLLSVPAFVGVVLSVLAGSGLASAPAMAAEFPVTIEHALGTATIDAPPERVLALGYNDQDFLYALGIAPIAVHEWWGGHPYATWPWAEAKRQELGATPEVMLSPETNVEWIAAQHPDLIVATYYNLDETSYRQLSQIAPVVAHPAGYPVWSAPWQEQLKLLDRATSGDTEAAEAVIAGLEAKTAAVRAEWPELAGHTAVVADLRDDQFTLWNSVAAPSRFLTSFGLVFPPDLDALADESGWIRLSPELVDMIDVDAVVWPIDNPEAGKQQAIEAQPLYQTLRLVEEGRSVFLDDGQGILASALWFQSPLSIGYVIDKLPPLLAAAVDGDPETVVTLE